MNVKTQLEEIRESIQDESVSYREIHFLESHVQHIHEGDIELLEWAGVPEEPRIVEVVLGVQVQINEHTGEIVGAHIDDGGLTSDGGSMAWSDEHHEWVPPTVAVSDAKYEFRTGLLKALETLF